MSVVLRLRSLSSHFMLRLEVMLHCSVSLRPATIRMSPLTTAVGASAHALLELLKEREQPALASYTLGWVLQLLRGSLAAFSMCDDASSSKGLRMPQNQWRGGAAQGAAYALGIMQAAGQKGVLELCGAAAAEGVTWEALSEVVAQMGSGENGAGRATLHEQRDPPGGADEAGLGADKEEGRTWAADANVMKGSGRATRGTEAAEMRVPASLVGRLLDAWVASGLAVITHAAAHSGSGDGGDGSANPDACDKVLPGVAALLRGMRAAQAACLAGYSAGAPAEGPRLVLHMRVLANLRLLALHPLCGARGALAQQQQLLASALDIAAKAASNGDASLRAAGLDTLNALVSHALRRPPVPLPAPDGSSSASQYNQPSASIRPECFAFLLPLALERMNDGASEVAAAAARLVAGPLAEPLFLAVTRGPGPDSSWLPAWQDALASAPQMRSMKPAQLARLWEVLFQSAATTTGGVLLRRRTPQPGVGEGGASGGDDEDRIEALQRLALGLLPAEGAAAGAEGKQGAQDAMGAARGVGGGAEGGGGSSVEEGAWGDEELDRALSGSSAALVWLVLQEAAKAMVGGKLRTHLGGPTHTLGALERMMQVGTWAWIQVP